MYVVIFHIINSNWILSAETGETRDACKVHNVALLASRTHLSIDISLLHAKVGLQTLYLMQVTRAVILISACAPCVTLLLYQLNVVLPSSRSWHLGLDFVVAL